MFSLLPSVFCPLCSVFSLQCSALCVLSSVFSLLSSVFCLQCSVFCRPPSVFCRPPSVFCLLSSALSLLCMCHMFLMYLLTSCRRFELIHIKCWNSNTVLECVRILGEIVYVLCLQSYSIIINSEVFSLFDHNKKYWLYLLLRNAMSLCSLTTQVHVIYFVNKLCTFF